MKRLYRSEREKIFCGVCGGLAEYFNIDPTIIRLAVALLFILNPGATLLLYLIACIIMPKGTEVKTREPTEEGKPLSPTTTPRAPALSSKEIETIVLLIIGVVLFIIGISLLSSTVFSLDVFGTFIASLGFLTFIAKILIGAVILAIGIVIILKTIKKYEET